jgi:hypothetical protein
MKKIILLFSLGLLVLFNSCSDAFEEDFEDVEKLSSVSTENDSNDKAVFLVNDQSFIKSTGEDSRQWKRTVLGEVRNNPYTVESILQAHVNLYGDCETSIKTTDLYVKFEPLTLDEMVLLEKSEEFFMIILLNTILLKWEIIIKRFPKNLFLRYTQ